MKYAIYDYDRNLFIGGLYDSYEEAVEDLDPRLNNCLILEVNWETF